MKSKAYRAVDVNRVDGTQWLDQRTDTVGHAGIDVRKEAG
jgi:hypothetical protein